MTSAKAFALATMAFLTAICLAAEPAPAAAVTLGAPAADRGVRILPANPTLTMEPVTKAGREAVSGKASGPGGEGYMYFAVNTAALRNGQARSLVVTIEYFDEGTGSIGFQYDSDDPTVCINNEPVGAFKSADSIELEDTGTWLTATIAIADARFSGRCAGGDFRLTIPAGGILIVSSVSATAVTPTAPAERTLAVEVGAYGALGDGVTDDTGAFQTALNRMGAQGGGTVRVPAGNYLIKTHLRIPTSVTLEGVSVLPTVPLRGQPPGPDAKRLWLQGSVLLAVEGAGRDRGPGFITLSSNSTLKGMTVFYPNQVLDGIPIPYPWTVRSAGGQNLGILDCLLVNPYQAVDFGSRAAHRHFIRNLYAEPLYKGIFIDNCGDVGRLENVHFWAFTELLTGTQNKIKAKWRLENGTALILGRSDWEYISNCFVIGFKIGFHFTKASGGGPGNYLITQSGADCGDIALQVDETQAHSGVSFVNAQMFGRILVNEGNLGPVRFTGCGIFGSSSGYFGLQGVACDDEIRIAGRGRVSFDNCHFNSIDGAARSERFLHAVGGRLAITNCLFMNSAKTTKNPAAVVMEEGVIAAIITGNEFYGADPISNRCKRAVVIKDNLTGTEVEAAPPPPRQEEPGALVITTADRAFTTTGTWYPGTSDADYQTGNRWTTAGDGTCTATFAPELPKAGRYTVQAWVGSDPNHDHAPEAPVTVVHADGEARLTIRLTENPGSWHSLGTFRFAAGRQAAVTLANGLAGNVVADAVKFVPAD